MSVLGEYFAAPISIGQRIIFGEDGLDIRREM